MNSKIVTAVAIGLVIGLVLGVFFSYILILPAILSGKSGVGIDDQVQVSGSLREPENGTITFESQDNEIESSAPIIDGKYTILLVGGKSYDVIVNNYNLHSPIYVPTGVTTFIADF